MLPAVLSGSRLTEDVTFPMNLAGFEVWQKYPHARRYLPISISFVTRFVFSDQLEGFCTFCAACQDTKPHQWKPGNSAAARVLLFLLERVECEIEYFFLNISISKKSDRDIESIFIPKVFLFALVTGWRSRGFGPLEPTFFSPYFIRSTKGLIFQVQV